MQLHFACPKCEQSVRTELTLETHSLACQNPDCDWTRPAPEGPVPPGGPAGCYVCNCHDLWRQKNFPPSLGLSMVGAGILLSTIAWAYMLPLVAIGVLMMFALIDLVLYAVMPDVLVCYRCGARHSYADIDERIPKFNLEVAERYRQENIRQENARRESARAGASLTEP